MIPSLWRALIPPPELLDLPYQDPLRERMFPTWRSAMIHAVAAAQRHRIPFEVRRDPEFSAWSAKPRSS